MKVYVSINEDRHIDTQVEVFTNAEEAVEYARTKAKQYAERWPEDYEEREIESWLFCATYTCERTDSFHVVETELRE